MRKAGVYDNRSTMRRELWGYTADGKDVAPVQSTSAAALTTKPEFGGPPAEFALHPWGHFPDIPKFTIADYIAETQRRLDRGDTEWRMTRAEYDALVDVVSRSATMYEAASQEAPQFNGLRLVIE